MENKLDDEPLNLSDLDLETGKTGKKNEIASKSSHSYGTAESLFSQDGKPIRLITHLSLTREDSPLLDPSKPRRKPFHRSSSVVHLLVVFWKKYQQSIEERPLLTKSITSAILTACGEIISQLITVNTANTIDGKRIWEFFLLGLVLQAPVTHYYYLVLDRELPPTDYPWTWTTLIKLLIDQLIYAPLFLLSVFLFLDTLEGFGRAAMWLHLHQEFGRTLVTNWTLWVPATLLNFAIIHPSYRVLYCNVIFFVWSIILAMLLSSPSAEESDRTL